jgi:23S rRNA pseudouridine1911/1915/1917 synthase
MSRQADLQTHHIVVAENNSQIRLDKLVTQLMPQHTRSYILRLIKSDCIHVNQHLKKPGYMVRTGDHITITIPENEPHTVLPEPIPLDIIFEDKDLLIVNKQAGLVVHPSPGHANGTFVNALLHYNSVQFSKVDRFGIVHRLDQDTTGCLLVAKNRASQVFMNNAFSERTIEKKYSALVHGQMKTKQGIIDFPIGRHPTNRKKMSIHARRYRSAETHWKISCQFNHFTLLELLLKTGRTHQIRVHLSAINHPIVGDPLYGRKKNLYNQKPEVQLQLKKINRQMLHAKELGFIHPRTKQFIHIVAPLPEDMMQTLKVLQKMETDPAK